MKDSYYQNPPKQPKMSEKAMAPKRKQARRRGQMKALGSY